MHPLARNEMQMMCKDFSAIPLHDASNSELNYVEYYYNWLIPLKAIIPW